MRVTGKKIVWEESFKLLLILEYIVQSLIREACAKLLGGSYAGNFYGVLSGSDKVGIRA